MGDFHQSHAIEATRKAHRCAECERKIVKGERVIVASGSYDGDFYCQHIHVDCDAVARAYAKQFDAWGEGTVRLHELFEVDELLWLMGEHSAVAERINAEKRLTEREQFWRDFFAFNSAA